MKCGQPLPAALAPAAPTPSSNQSLLGRREVQIVLVIALAVIVVFVLIASSPTGGGGGTGGPPIGNIFSNIYTNV